jgi:hypothetical protein
MFIISAPRRIVIAASAGPHLQKRNAPFGCGIAIKEGETLICASSRYTPSRTKDICKARVSRAQVLAPEHIPRRENRFKLILVR